MDVILFSTADWDEPYWTNKQHTACHLAERGNRVLYVESVGLRSPKLSSGRDLGRIWRRLKRAIKGPRKTRDNLWVYSPLVLPFKHHWPIVRYINQGILRISIGLFKYWYRFLKPVVWTYHPFILQTFSKKDMFRLVYHCVDDLSAIPGIDFQSFREEEVRLLQLSDVVFTTSSALYKQCSLENPNTHFFPNVADFDHFSKANESGEIPFDLAGVPEPRIAYVGVLSDFKVDFSLVKEVVEARPDWNWLFVGEEREGQKSQLLKEIKVYKNVFFLGRKDYQSLPFYLRGMNVGVLPSVINEYTRSMFPMKYFEYLAAGLPLVSTPLDFTEQFKSGIEVAGNSAEFIVAIEKQLARGRIKKADTVRFVGENTWSARLDKMLALLNATAGK